jgi:membrane protease subunit HflC
VRNLAPAIAAAVVIVALFLMGQSTYIVAETEQAIVTQFGKPVGEPATAPGLYVKAPFVQVVYRFEKRFLEWDGERNQLPTRDKRFIFVDTYARWRIVDPLKFFQRLRDEQGAQSRLDDILDGEARNVIAKHDLIEVVRSTDREFAADEELGGGSEGAEFKVVAGRSKLAAEVLTASQARVADLGIEILDFRFKRINYVDEVRKEVYNRMISERKRIAEQFRAEGKGEAARITGEKERDLAAIQSEAFKQAEEVRGEADAKAAAIYAAAYERNRDLYAFTKSLETARTSIDENTVLLLSTKGELLKVLDGSD